MLNVLIVDDEMLVRMGMISMIPWEEHGFRVIGDVGDGYQALQAIHRQEPDIVLTDIVMPGLDGIGLIHKLRRQYPDIKIIVLSSHHDFEYVREAMKLGACDYVLKTSLKPNDFIAVLEQVADRIREEQARAVRPAAETDAAESRKYALLSLLASADEAQSAEPCEEAGRASDAAREAALELDGAYGTYKRILYIRAHHLLDRPDGKAVERTLFHVLVQQMKQSGEAWAEAGEVFEYKDSEWFAAVGSPDRPLTDTAVKRLSGRMLRAAHRYTDTAISIGVSKSFTDWQGFFAAFKQAREALQCSFYDGLGNIYLHQQGHAMPDIGGHTAEDMQAVAQHIQLGDGAAAAQWLDEWHERIRALRPKVNQVKAFYLEIAHLIKKECEQLQMDWPTVYSEQPFYVYLLQMETLGDIHGWMKRFVLGVMERLEELRRSTYRDEIMRLTDHLKRHYMHPISLGEAARIACMSESHLSYLFKKETGHSFVEYMTGLRIERASELLRSTDLTRAEIAQQVGYENINYFSRAFKKVTGVSPTQYKEIVKK